MAEYNTGRQLRHKRRETLQEEIELLQKEKEYFDKKEQVRQIQNQRKMLILQRRQEALKRMHTSNSNAEEVFNYPAQEDERNASNIDKDEYQSEEESRNSSFSSLDETEYFDQESPRKSPVCENQEQIQQENEAESSLDLSAETEALDQKLMELYEDDNRRDEQISVEFDSRKEDTHHDTLERSRTPMKRVTIQTEPYEKVHRRRQTRRQMPLPERGREYYTLPKETEITKPVRKHHYKMEPVDEELYADRGTDAKLKHEGESADTDVISDNEILEYQNRIRQIEAERRRLDQLKQDHDKKIQQMLEQKKQFKLQKERKRKEEEHLLRSIELLELKEKEIDEKEKESSDLQASLDVSVADDIAMDKRLKILKLKESETMKRIAQKERHKTSTPTTDKKEEKVEKLSIEKALLGKPYLPAFEGKNYEDWKMEVSCLIKSNMYQEKVLAQAIRSSLKGQTRKILLSMSPTASASDLMEKLEEVYGSLKESDTLLQDFFSAWQNPTESSSDWGIRIENLFQRVADKGDVDELNRNDMLKRKFWRGLHSDKLREALRVSYESKDTFEILRKKSRREEEDIEMRRKKENTTEPERTEDVKPKITQQVRANTETDVKLDRLLDRMKELEDQMKTMSVQKQYGPPDFLRNKAPNRYMNNRRQRGRFGYRHQGVRGQGMRGRGRENPKEDVTVDESEQDKKTNKDKAHPLNR